MPTSLAFLIARSMQYIATVCAERGNDKLELLLDFITVVTAAGIDKSAKHIAKQMAEIIKC